MAETTNIEWADATFNPWIGCTKVSPACDHCYAEVSMPARLLHVSWGPHAERHRTSASNWALPLRWEREHEAFEAEHGRRRRVFCASLADVFDNAVPAAWRTDLFALISATPHLDWLLLTKRVGNVESMIMDALRGMFQQTNIEPSTWPWPHVWLGATIVNQAEADRDIPRLLQVPARVRFVSIEPLLGPIDVSRYIWPVCGWWKGSFSSYREAKAAGAECGLKPQGLVSAHARFVDWVIVGGESGHNARPMHPDGVRQLRDQCASAGVPFLFKQWGEHLAGELAENPAYPGDEGAWRMDQAGRRWHDPMESMKPRSEWMPIKFTKAGKKTAGRLLDGVEHNGFPKL